MHETHYVACCFRLPYSRTRRPVPPQLLRELLALPQAWVDVDRDGVECMLSAVDQVSASIRCSRAEYSSMG